MKKIGYVLLCLIGILIFSLPVHAISGRLQLVPAHPETKNPKSFTYLIINGKPGEEKKGEFAAVNLSGEKMELKFTPSDATVNDKGEIVGGSGQTGGVGGWLTLPEDGKENQLLPKQRKNFPYTLKIPQDAKPGEHVGAIVANDEASIPVWVKVEGDTSYDFVLTGFSQEVGDGLPVFKVKVKNTGNTVISSLGFKVVLNNHIGIGLGRRLESFWGEETAILSNTEKEFSLNYENPLPAIGNYTADLSVTSGNSTKEDSHTFSFTNMKAMGGFILQLLLFLLAVSAFVFGIFKLRKRLSERLLENKLNTNIFNRNSADTSGNFPGQNTALSPPAGSDFGSSVRKIALEEGNMALASEEDYDKIWFKVRKIVREEIELWKEMEKYRKEMKSEIKKELLKEKKEKSARN